MAIILLTQGYSTIVDDDLYEELNSYSWYASGAEGRPARRLKTETRRLIYIYHQILNVLPWIINNEGKVIDHIDGNPLNNQRNNLRIVSQQDNMLNGFRHKTKTGICFSKNENKFKAYLDRPKQKRIWLGTFVKRETAEIAVQQAKEEYECV